VSAVPKISVLLPCYEQERFLGEALSSVLAQDFTEWELVASDDASSDGSHTILESFARKDRRIRVFSQPQTLGMVANWNFCLRQAQGTAVKLMGGDDVLIRKDCLSRQWDALKNPRVVLAASARIILDEHSAVLHTLANLPTGLFPTDEMLPRAFLHPDNLVGEPVCCLFRRAEAARGFHPGYLQNTDIEMWLHLLEKGSLAYESEALVGFRKHQRQASLDNWQSGRALEEHRLLILEKARVKDVPKHIKFQVLLRGEDTLTYADSENIRQAVRLLAENIGSGLRLHRFRHNLIRTFSRWLRSLRKRIRALPTFPAPRPG